MKKVAVLIAILLISIFCSAACSLRSEQYNSEGISHFLVVTIDENQPKEFIGELDNYRIFVEKINLNETCFRNVNAEDVSIKEAVDNKLVSVKEWKKYARSIKQEGDAEILKFENYEIAIAYDDCIIRPLS